MNKNTIIFIKELLPSLMIICLLSVLIYIAVQQTIRLSANDPQIQLSEDLASQLSDKRTITLSPTKIDIKQSLASFAIIYNAKGEIIQSSASLNNQDPQIPQGVLTYAKDHIQNRVTWQPEKGIRIATVVTYYKKDDIEGYVLVGRSLREAEKRIEVIGLQIFSGTVIILLGYSVVKGIVFFHNLRTKS